MTRRCPHFCCKGIVSATTPRLHRSGCRTGKKRSRTELSVLVASPRPLRSITKRHVQVQRDSTCDLLAGRRVAPRFDFIVHAISVAADTLDVFGTQEQHRDCVVDPQHDGDERTDDAVGIRVPCADQEMSEHITTNFPDDARKNSAANGF